MAFTEEQEAKLTKLLAAFENGKRINELDPAVGELSAMQIEVMDETGVLGLLEELSILLEDSKPVFGKNNLRQVDIAAAFDIMDEIRDLFPAEFSQARQIVRERQSLLDDAEVEANRMIEDARSQAITIASEQEIVRISQQQADTILADARELERQTRAGAEDYADEVFGHIEQSLDTLLNNTRRCRDRLNAAR